MIRRGLNGDWAQKFGIEDIGQYEGLKATTGPMPSWCWSSRRRRRPMASSTPPAYTPWLEKRRDGSKADISLVPAF